MDKFGHLNMALYFPYIRVMMGACLTNKNSCLSRHEVCIKHIFDGKLWVMGGVRNGVKQNNVVFRKWDGMAVGNRQCGMV